MNIFNKRPLSLILFSILGGFSIFALVGYIFKAILFTVCAIALVSIIFIDIPNKKRLTVGILLSILCSFILSFIYFEYIFYPAYTLTDEESVIEAKIIDLEEGDNYVIIDLKLSSLDGKKCTKKVKLTAYNDDHVLSVGDTVRFKGKLAPFDSKDGFDFASYYTSSGFSAEIEAYEGYTIEILDRGNIPLSYKFKTFRNSICEKAEAFTNEKTAGLLGALLLGERDRLDPQIRLDFSRIGITHILSLSGLHLAIIVAALSFILKLFKAGRKVILSVNCLFCLSFMALTGFPLSVCRAGLMLIVSSIVFMLSGAKDSITSLSIAATLIIALSPYSVFDIGLWLSVIATFGILVSVDMTCENETYSNGFKRKLKAILLSFLFSLFAICATTAISSIAFGTFPVLSIFSTFVISFIVQAFIYVGIALLLSGGFAPLSSATIFLGNVIESISARLSDIPNVCPSASSPIIIACSILLTVLFFIFAVFDIKRKKTFITAIGMFYVFIAVLSVLFSSSSLKGNTVTVSHNEGEAIIIRSQQKALLFSASAQRKGNGYNDLDLLSKEGISELDTLYLAHITNYTPYEVGKVLSGIRTKKVVLPMPKDKDENDIIIKTITVIEDFRTEYGFHSDSEATDFGEYKIFVLHRSYDENSFAVNFFTSDYSISYLSDGILENSIYAEELMYVSDYVIFGDYGTAYSSNKTVYDCSERLKTVISFNKHLSFDFELSGDHQPTVITDQKTVVIDPKKQN